jgi:ATP-binding cassette, subfamily B, bacterial PglK
MIRSFKLFTNTFQRILVSSFFLLQLLISVLEFLFLSMIPTMVIYMTNPDVAESNIRNFQNYISQNYFELNIDISIYTYIFILIFGLLLKNILSILNTFLEGGTIRIINYFNIQKIYSYYLNQPLEQIVANRNSEFIRDIISESSKAVAHLFNYLLIFKEIILFFAIFLSIYFNNQIIAFVLSIIFIILMIGVYFSLNKKLTEKGKIQLKTEANIIENINNYLGVIKEIKIYKLEKFFKEYFSSNLSQRLKSQMFRFIVQKILRNVFEIILILLITVGAIITKNLNQNFNDLLPLLGLLIVAFLRLVPIITNINSSFAGIIYSRPSFINIQNVIKNLHIMSMQKNFKKKKIIIDKFKTLDFKNIEFSYNNSKILDNFSFQLQSNKVIGITGDSGSGKSTILNIITGLLKIQKGTVLADDMGILDNDFTINNNKIGYVPQDVFLINGSILSNIALGDINQDIDKQNLNLAIKVAGLEKIFDKNKNINLKTEIFDKGHNLSGGQKQRIGIARALYRKPSLLILDEATNQIENKTKLEIIRELKIVYKNMTTIIVSHDNSVIDFCDYIINLNKK